MMRNVLPRSVWEMSGSFSQVIHRVPVVVAANGVRVEIGIPADKKKDLGGARKKFGVGVGFS